MTIYCPINLFVLKQKIYVLDDEKSSVSQIGTADLNSVGKNIADFIMSSHAHKVILKGNEDYCQEVKEQILSIASSNYNLSDIEVEIV